MIYSYFYVSSSDCFNNSEKTMRLMKLLIMIYLLLIIVSCTNDEDKYIVGPCVHTNNEPILNITAVRDSINSKVISFVTLKELKINGILQNTNIMLSNSYSVAANDSIYYCNVPFGLGSQEGHYEFILEADGYSPKLIKIENVNYSISQGGCPSYSDGGTRIELFIN